nr:hypothetical protein [Tanacetum cinerariifolium]
MQTFATLPEDIQKWATLPEDIQKWVTAEAEAVQIILIGIDNNIYSIVDAYPNAIEMFVAIVKQSQDLKKVSYHKLYDILKQYLNEVNEIRAERLARTANPLAFVAQQQQPVYHPQPNPTHYTQSSSTRSQAATRNRGKAIANSPPPTYDPEPKVVADDDASSKEKSFPITLTWSHDVAPQLLPFRSSQILQRDRLVLEPRPNGKMIVDSIENGPYVRRMSASLGEPDLPVPVPESFHEQTD